MRILIVSDAWTPQVNGVVRTLQKTCRELGEMGHAVEVIGPDRFRTVPCPTYPEITLAIFPGPGVARAIEAFAPDAIHVATEGPLGLAARRYCIRRGFAFTTAYHTAFPEYIQARTRIPLSLGYGFMRWFHGASDAVMVATQSLQDRLAAHGFKRIKTWSRGVDTDVFKPRDKSYLKDPRPIALYAGRLALDKNIEAFLDADFTGTKYVVGTGPELERLKARYPQARFTGYIENGTLAAHIAAADVFVFPSRTDTFGLVILEALASGVPVAAYPVTGPIDVIGQTPVGCMDEDLSRAMTGALGLSPQACRDHALAYSWAACTRQFLDNLSPMRPARDIAAD
jgi:glycosyltransferase involved in cell wall biosynthesis